MSRIDITTSNTTNAATPGSSPNYLGPLDYLAFITVGINEFVLINRDVATRARSLEYVDHYEHGKLLVRKQESQNRCGLGITLADTGIGYRIQAPEAPRKDYVGRLISKPGDEEDAKNSE